MTQKRALISVSDKTGVIELAQGLYALGWEMISTGNTARAIREADVPVLEVADVTGFPEMMDGRLKTLHPKVHGGILSDRSAEHSASMANHGIASIDLVFCNLYPFTSDPSIELIDIGGPTMVRGAAKNHAHVGVVVDPSDYGPVLDELKQLGQLSDATRRRLARTAFAHTAAYDSAIVSWFDEEDGETFPATLHFTFTQAPHELRYGENPHQKGAIYALDGTEPWWLQQTQHSGMAMSYLNWFDTDAAWRLVHEPAFGDRPICAIIKHANPCGFAVADTLADAYQRAYTCDEQSAFGGIVAVNRSIDRATAERIVLAEQADVIIAPGFEAGVLEMLRAKRKNTRLLEAVVPKADRLHLRQVTNGLLVQQPHRFDATPDTWEVKTKRQPRPAELADAWVAFVLNGYVKSNSIVDVQGGVAFGIGAGQQNRAESARIAAAKAAGRAEGGASGSDAFIPFVDGLEAIAAADVAVVVQPGGSVRDSEVVDKADELGIAMMFTGERHFNH